VLLNGPAVDSSLYPEEDCSMADPETVYSWRRLDDRITASGQPTEAQLADIQALGVRHIVGVEAPIRTETQGSVPAVPAVPPPPAPGVAAPDGRDGCGTARVPRDGWDGQDGSAHPRSNSSPPPEPAPGGGPGPDAPADVVRRLVGDDRYATKVALAALQEVSRLARPWVNFCRPVRKLVAKERVGAKVRKRFDRARTPYQRLRAAAALDPAQLRA
jgi:hypothetical protein